MYNYQQNHLFTAQVADGIEDLARDELAQLGATDCAPGFRFVHFKADHRALYRIVYRSRLSTRILAPWPASPALTSRPSTLLPGTCAGRIS